jgi:hypothetical protein
MRVPNASIFCAFRFVEPWAELLSVPVPLLAMANERAGGLTAAASWYRGRPGCHYRRRQTYLSLDFLAQPYLSPLSPHEGPITRHTVATARPVPRSRFFNGRCSKNVANLQGNACFPLEFDRTSFPIARSVRVTLHVAPLPQTWHWHHLSRLSRFKDFAAQVEVATRDFFRLFVAGVPTSKHGFH